MGRVLWDLLHGLRSEVRENAKPHSLLFQDELILRQVLLEVLSSEPQSRPPDAGGIADSLRKAFSGEQDASQVAKTLSIADLAAVRVRIGSIRELAGELLTGADALYVPKDIRDHVDFVYQCLCDEHTETMDVAGELRSCGAKGLPAIVEGAYKLDESTNKFQQLTDAVSGLARSFPDAATRTVAAFCLSSNYAAR